MNKRKKHFKIIKECIINLKKELICVILQPLHPFVKRNIYLLRYKRLAKDKQAKRQNKKNKWTNNKTIFYHILQVIRYK